MDKMLKIVSIAFVIMIGIGVLLFRNMKRQERIDKMMTGEMPDIDKDRPKEVEKATFSLGCFWGPDAKFGTLDGVIRTRVGYAGGNKENPTYHNLGEHTETIQIFYDPDKISYEKLLDIFWQSHEPTVRRSTQYMSRIFYHNENQQRVALESKEDLEKELNKDIKTVISEFNRFYKAEDYHQKYYLKQHKDFLSVYREIYSNHNKFLKSTAVSRANGYVVGDGYLESPESLIDMGLSEEGRKKLFEDWMDAQDYSGKSCSTPFT